MVDFTSVAHMSGPSWSDSMGRTAVVDLGHDQSGMGAFFLFIIFLQWAYESFAALISSPNMLLAAKYRKKSRFLSLCCITETMEINSVNALYVLLKMVILFALNKSICDFWTFSLSRQVPA